MRLPAASASTTMLERLNTDVSAYSAACTWAGWWASQSSHSRSRRSRAAASGATTVSVRSPSGTLRGATTTPSNGSLRGQPRRIAWSRSVRPWPTLATTGAPAAGTSAARLPRTSSNALCHSPPSSKGTGCWSSSSSTSAPPRSVMPWMWSSSMWLTTARSIRSGSPPGARAARSASSRGRRLFAYVFTGPPSISTSRSPACRISASPWNAWSASSENTTASDRLDGAEGVDHPAALEVALAAQVGGRRAEHPLDLAWLADQLRVACHQQRRCAGDVRGGHARPVEALEAQARDRRGDLFARGHEVGLHATVAGRAAAGEIGDAVGVGLVAVGGPDGDHALGVAGVRDRDLAVALGGARGHGVVRAALVARGGHHDGAAAEQALALVAHRGAPARVGADLVVERQREVDPVDDRRGGVGVHPAHELEGREDGELVAGALLVEHPQVVELHVGAHALHGVVGRPLRVL